VQKNYRKNKELGDLQFFRNEAGTRTIDFVKFRVDSSDDSVCYPYFFLSGREKLLEI